MFFNFNRYFTDEDGIVGGESVEETEVAEPSTVETEADTESEQVEETEAEPAPQQSAEENARYAAIRRQAEADAAKRYGDIDAYYATRFKGQVNPITNQPIRTARDYMEAMQAQDKLQQEESLRSAGLDPQLIDRAIENSPAIQQAKAIEERYRYEEANRIAKQEIEKIIAFDPSVASEADIAKQANIGEVMSYVERTGTPLSDAYKIINFDRLMGYKAEAAKQAAVNQAKSKGHLSQAPSVAGEDKNKDIPESALSHWKAIFPDKSAKELKALYNRQQSH